MYYEADIGLLRLLPVLVLVFSTLLCTGAYGLGEEGEVSGPELVWMLYEPDPVYAARGLVRCGDGGFVIAAERSSPLSAVGGEVVARTCDEGFILTCNFAVDEQGRALLPEPPLENQWGGRGDLAEDLD